MKRKTTKDKILQEALRLFACEGYGDVSVEQIASAVGIKAPSLYKHYKSKRDIFDSILARMVEMDAEGAREHSMPETTVDNDEEAYKKTSVRQIKTYTKAQFLHWTQDEFSSCFRRLLTIEKYRNPEMKELYHQYLAGGPLDYMKDIFASLTGKSEGAEETALEFYAPIFMLYYIYDAAEDKEAVIKAADSHIERFFCRFEERKGRN
ncbi:MAG: helix-turn-helix domain-containing protein [Clostridia bacterium]|nr:helix-turn-helix domain-containing protein [Clostridia bacterium]